MNKILALANLCMPTFFFNVLAGAPTTEINSLIFKYPALKKNNYQEEVSIDFILFFYFIPVCGTRSYCIFYCRWLLSPNYWPSANCVSILDEKGGGRLLILKINYQNLIIASISNMPQLWQIVFVSYLIAEQQAFELIQLDN